MPPPVKSPVKSPLRFCVSCCVTLGCWAVWLVLAAALAAQIYVIAAKDLPVPGFVLRRIEAELAAQNLAVRFGQAHFDPDGHLLLENLELRSVAFEEPILTSRLVYLRKSPWSVLAGRLVPDEVRLEGATLQLPAMLSPSGAPEPLFREVAASLRFDQPVAHVDQFAFKLDRLAVTVRGSVQAPRGEAGADWSLEDLAQRFVRLGRTLALQLPHLHAVENPALTLDLSPRPEGGFAADWLFTADSLREPAGMPLRLGPFSARGAWHTGRPATEALDLDFATGRLAYGDHADVAALRGHLTVRPTDSLLRPEGLAWSVAAGAVEVRDESVPGVVLRGDVAPGRGGLALDAALPLENEVFTVAVRADLREKTATVDLAGLVRPALVNRNLTRYTPRLAPYLNFLDPVALTASATFAPGWKFSGLQSRVRGGRLDSHGVPVTTTLGRIDLSPGLDFLAHEATARIGENYGRGSYWMNFRTMDYRLLLNGRLRPPAITGWFRSAWWPAFWRNFEFAAPPWADVDVSGNWRDGSRTSYYGYTRAAEARVLGADFERLRTRIFVRPRFIRVQVDEAGRAGGLQQAAGWFERISDDDRLATLRFDLQGNLDAPTLTKLAGETAASLLAPWQFTEPPALHVQGRIDYPEGRAQPDLEFSGRAALPVRYFGFPLDAISAEGRVRGATVQLDAVDFKVAGGTGSGKASISGTGRDRQLGFDLYLKDADLARTIRATEEYEAARSGLSAVPPVKESRFMKRASGGRLELALSAQGNPDSFESFRGSGNLKLTGAELAEVQLFGLLSQVLSAVSLNFSSLKLDTARSSFQLDQGRLHFPDVKLTGPNSVTDAVGDFRFANKSLDFAAKFRPYEENRNLLTGVIGLVVNPISSFFELKLTGTLANPKWSMVIGPGSLRTPPSAPAGGTPPPGSTGEPALVPATPPPLEPASGSEIQPKP